MIKEIKPYYINYYHNKGFDFRIHKQMFDILSQKVTSDIDELEKELLTYVFTMSLNSSRIFKVKDDVYISISYKIL